MQSDINNFGKSLHHLSETCFSLVVIKLRFQRPFNDMKILNFEMEKSNAKTLLVKVPILREIHKHK